MTSSPEGISGMESFVQDGGLAVAGPVLTPRALVAPRPPSRSSYRAAEHSRPPPWWETVAPDWYPRPQRFRSWPVNRIALLAHRSG